MLASASLARRRLLEQAGIPHRVQASGLDEDHFAATDPENIVLELAAAKARAVVSALLAQPPTLSPPPAVGLSVPVLGCDSLLELDGEVLGKPRNPTEAVTRWKRMAGNWGSLHTGHALIGERGQTRLQTVTTRVRFAPLSRTEIEAYVATGEPMACAGGFALEGRGGLVVERIEGCYSNVIGLSLPLLYRWLGAMGG